MAGELRDAPLPMVTGGFLCEEMGLGKTVEMCALVLANPYTPQASAAGRTRLCRGAYERRTTQSTLVVCPQVLLGQWQAEIRKCSGDVLKVYVHHGEVALRKPGRDLSPLETADVVLTTYEMLQRESPWPPRDRALLRMHWWRLVLDESQRVPKPANARSAMSNIAKACEELSRTHTWCMSGTPVSSVVDELLGQLIVLGVEPYCSRGDKGDAFWEREVSGQHVFFRRSMTCMSFLRRNLLNITCSIGERTLESSRPRGPRGCPRLARADHDVHPQQCIGADARTPLAHRRCTYGSRPATALRIGAIRRSRPSARRAASARRSSRCPRSARRSCHSGQPQHQLQP